MWCTRWFLPLVILPLPTAPPYFLAVLLVSLFLHARPCFYCMMLLAALFTSSCYWQALPIDAPLSQPLGNATTFGEALRANASTTAMASIQLPPGVQLLDRCWCNVFSRNGLFEPSDVSEWELASVVRTRRSLEMQARKEEEGGKEEEDIRVAGTGEAVSESRASIPEADIGKEQDSDTYDSPASSSFSFRGLRDIFFPTTMTPSSKYRLKPASSPTTSLVSPAVPSPELSPSPSTAVELKPDSVQSDTKPAVRKDPHPTSGVPSKLLRRYYDLRPYGLDVTIDFSWNR